MNVGIIQSSYIPWKGYFDFIDDVDLFVFHDDLQYTKCNWRNRNKIKTKNGSIWLTVPVKYHSVSQLIMNTPIDYAQNWQQKHLTQIKENYHTTPYFPEVFDEIKEIILQKYSTISELNLAFTKWIMKRLFINTPVMMSSELRPVGSKTERLIDLLKKLNADKYLSGPSAENYLEYNLFQEANIELEFKSYSYKEYDQLFPPFEHAVTVLDLIFNCGFEVRKYFKSEVANQMVVAHANQPTYNFYGYNDKSIRA